MKIKIAKHALDDVEETMENSELQEFLDMLKEKVDDGSFFEDSEPVDMERMKIEEPDVYEKLIEALDELDNEPKLN